MPPRSDAELAELAARLAPRVRWDTFLWRFRQGEPDGFKQGDHVTILGPTGSGKTTIAKDVVESRDYVLGIFTKPRDPLIDALARNGWRRTGQLDIRVQNGQLIDRWVAYHPQFTGTMRERKVKQTSAVQNALDYAFTAERWCVFVDEGLWVAKHLRLGEELEMFWFQARTLDVSLVALGQRPRHIPLAAYSQVQHLFLGQTTDREDLDRVSELGAGGPVDTELVRYVLQTLREHEFLYVQPRTGLLLIVKVDRPVLSAEQEQLRAQAA